MPPVGIDAKTVEETTTAVLEVCHLAVWFQRHCSQAELDDQRLDWELKELDEAAKNAIKLYKQAAKAFFNPDVIPDRVLNQGGISCHEIALKIVEQLVRGTYVNGQREERLILGEQDLRVTDWVRARHFVTECAVRLNERNSLNATADFDALCDRVRYESMRALTIVNDGRSNTRTEAEQTPDPNPDDSEVSVSEKREIRASESADKSGASKPRGRRGRRGVSVNERYTEIERIYQYESAKELPPDPGEAHQHRQLSSGEMQKSKKRIKVWLGRDWDKKREDETRWRDQLDNDRQIELCRMRDYLLKRWERDTIG